MKGKYGTWGLYISLGFALVGKSHILSNRSAGSVIWDHHACALLFSPTISSPFLYPQRIYHPGATVYSERYHDCTGGQSSAHSAPDRSEIRVVIEPSADSRFSGEPSCSSNSSSASRHLDLAWLPRFRQTSCFFFPCCAQLRVQ